MGERFKPRWYGTVTRVKPRGCVQVNSLVRERRHSVDPFTLPEDVLRLAQREYESQFGHQQDYERMQERGGLGILEVIALLADLAERHGATPTEPRAS